MDKMCMFLFACIAFLFIANRNYQIINILNYNFIFLYFRTKTYICTFLIKVCKIKK
jgi:hypothetical protein